jgi:hypothetical protein
MKKRERDLYERVYDNAEHVHDLSSLEDKGVSIIHFDWQRLVLELESGEFVYIYTDLPNEYGLEAFLTRERV